MRSFFSRNLTFAVATLLLLFAGLTSAQAQPTTVPVFSGTFFVLETSVPAGHSVHVSAYSLFANKYDTFHYNILWNFNEDSAINDPISGKNINLGLAFPGPVAAKRFYSLGMKTITCSIYVRNDDGSNGPLAYSSARKVSVVPANRTVYFLDGIRGNDADSGLTAALAFKTADRAGKILSKNDVELRPLPQSYTQTAQWIISGSNVLISPTSGIAKFTMTHAGSMLAIVKSAKDVTIASVEFDSTWNPVPKNGAVQEWGIAYIGNTAGTNLTFMDCIIDHMGGDFILANSDLHGLFLLRCTQGVPWGLRNRFLWAQGSDLVMAGCKTMNSFGESPVRADGPGDPSTGAIGLSLVANTIGQITGVGTGWGTRKAAVTLRDVDGAFLSRNAFANAEVSTSSPGYPHLANNIDIFDNQLTSVTAGDTDGCFNIQGGSNWVNVEKNYTKTFGVAAFVFNQNTGDARLNANHIFFKNNAGAGDKQLLKLNGTAPDLQVTGGGWASTQPSH